MLAGVGIWLLLDWFGSGLDCLSAFIFGFIGLQIAANVWRR